MIGAVPMIGIILPAGMALPQVVSLAKQERALAASARFNIGPGGGQASLGEATRQILQSGGDIGMSSSVLGTTFAY